MISSPAGDDLSDLDFTADRGACTKPAAPLFELREVSRAARRLARRHREDIEAAVETTSAS